MYKHDLVIRGGTVYDGQGGAGVTADVGIVDGRIAEVGRISAKGLREIDASGAIVTPGFVDIHTHYDGQATWSNRLHPSSHHGVTTVVMGNCGVGFAPCREQDRGLLIELMEGVEDIPGAALHEGLSWAWESFPEYLHYLAQRHYDMDIAAQLPHAALRVFVMGERGANREAATAEDIEQMRRLTAEAIESGAIGFSSSRTLNHRSSKGAPTPSLSAEAAELMGICEGMRDAAGGVIEMISDFEDLQSEFDTLEQMVSVSGRPMSISLAQGINPQGWRKLLAKIAQANCSGVTIRGQVAPRAIGILMGNTTTLNPFSTRPSYEEVARLPLTEKIRALNDGARKRKILAQQPSAGFARLFNSMANGQRVWELGDPPDYEPRPEDSANARATASGQDVWEYIYDRLLSHDGNVLFYVPFANYAENNLDCCREMMLSDHTVMGLGDGGAHVGTICDASFTTSLLCHWGRDRQRGERIPLGRLIEAQTRDTARSVGLEDRGVLAPGMRADINIIDFDKLTPHAPYMVYDLPLGGGRLEQRADGYIATLVHGELTYEHGEATDALPGRLIR